MTNSSTHSPKHHPILHLALKHSRSILVPRPMKQRIAPGEDEYGRTATIPMLRLIHGLSFSPAHAKSKESPVSATHRESKYRSLLPQSPRHIDCDLRSQIQQDIERVNEILRDKMKKPGAADQATHTVPRNVLVKEETVGLAKLVRRKLKRQYTEKQKSKRKPAAKRERRPTSADYNQKIAELAQTSDPTPEDFRLLGVLSARASLKSTETTRREPLQKVNKGNEPRRKEMVYTSQSVRDRRIAANMFFRSNKYYAHNYSVEAKDRTHARPETILLSSILTPRACGKSPFCISMDNTKSREGGHAAAETYYACGTGTGSARHCDTRRGTGMAFRKVASVKRIELAPDSELGRRLRTVGGK